MCHSFKKYKFLHGLFSNLGATYKNGSYSTVIRGSKYGNTGSCSPQRTVTLPATRRKNKLTISQQQQQQQQQQRWRLSLDSSNSQTIALHPH